MNLLATLHRTFVLPIKYQNILRRNREPRDSKGILILGWYGMETTGDKAILASILQNPALHDTQIYQASYDVEYSRQTLREIGCTHVRVVGNDERSFAEVLPMVDVVIIGGGPLMQGREMRRWYRRLQLAKQLNKRVMIYGCGVGPIRSSKEARAIRKLLSVADEVCVRDDLAAAAARKLGTIAAPITVSADPVLNFRYSSARSAVRAQGRLRVGMSVRSLPRSYFSAQQTTKTLEEFREEYQSVFVRAIEHLCSKSGVEVCLVPMQLHEGDDDRVLLRRLRSRVANNERVSIIESYASPDELVQQFEGFDFFVGMRFHSVVFSYVTATPAVGIDYDMEQGKVSGIMRLMGNSDFTINIRDLTAERLIETIDRGLLQREQMREQISQQLQVVQQQERQNAEKLNSLLRAA